MAAAGSPRFVQGNWLRPGAVVIDVGIHRLPTKQLVGDVDFESAAWAGIENSLGDFVLVFDVYNEDLSFLERALEAARLVAIPHYREIIHIIQRGFSVDGQDGVTTPSGALGTPAAQRRSVEGLPLSDMRTADTGASRGVQPAGLGQPRRGRTQSHPENRPAQAHTYPVGC